MKRGLLISVLCLPGLLAFLKAEQQLPTVPSLPPSERARQRNIPSIQPDPTDPAQKAQREARSSIFTFGGPLLPLGTSGDFHFLMTVDMRFTPELPADDEDTDAVVYGEIVNQQIFVTQRKRGLYTEYTLQVSRMLKPLDKVATGSRLSVLRLGGLAKLPSGGTIEHEIRGYGPEPMVGSQYLFFLKYLPSPADAYTILKFWNVVRLEDGTKIVKAAFDQDLQRVQNKESNVDGSPFADVEAMIQISH